MVNNWEWTEKGMNADTTKDIQRIELLVQIARLYYEYNFSQNEIAKKVHLSRPYVSKLLNEAKREGIVRIEIKDPIRSESLLERKIRQYFGLRKVIVVPRVDGENPLQQVGVATARYLDSILTSGDVIGFSWGGTVYECAKALQKRDDLRNITAIQMCGGISNLQKNVYVSEITKAFVDMLNGSGYMLPFPAIVDSRQLREEIDKEKTMQQVMEYADKISVAIITTGQISNQCALARAGYLKPEEIHQLKEKGAVGDVCTHVINADGEICDEELDARTVTVPYESIKKIETRIGVAIGELKVESIFGILAGEVVNVFVTDENTAELMKALRPEIFE